MPKPKLAQICHMPKTLKRIPGHKAFVRFAICNGFDIADGDYYFYGQEQFSAWLVREEPHLSIGLLFDQARISIDFIINKDAAMLGFEDTSYTVSTANTRQMRNRKMPPHYGFLQRAIDQARRFADLDKLGQLDRRTLPSDLTDTPDPQQPYLPLVRCIRVF